MEIKLQQELNRYFESKDAFVPYFKSMQQIVYSPLFQEQLQEITSELEKEDSSSAKSFKSYLDAVIVNMQTKIAKYKPSRYFENESVKEIENQGCIIPFYIDEAEESYVLLGIIKKMTDHNNI